MKEIKMRIKKLQSLMLRGTNEKIVINELDSIFDSIHKLENEEEVKECLLELLKVSDVLNDSIPEEIKNNSAIADELETLGVLEKLLGLKIKKSDFKTRTIPVKVIEEDDRFKIIPEKKVSINELDTIIEKISPRYKKQVLEGIAIAQNISVFRLEFKFVKNIYVNLSNFVDVKDMDEFTKKFLLETGIVDETDLDMKGNR